MVWEVLAETREITFEIAEKDVSVETRIVKESESVDGEDWFQQETCRLNFNCGTQL